MKDFFDVIWATAVHLEMIENLGLNLPPEIQRRWRACWARKPRDLCDVLPGADRPAENGAQDKQPD